MSARPTWCHPKATGAAVETWDDQDTKWQRINGVWFFENYPGFWTTGVRTPGSRVKLLWDAGEGESKLWGPVSAQLPEPLYRRHGDNVTTHVRLHLAPGMFRQIERSMARERLMQYFMACIDQLLDNPPTEFNTEKTVQPDGEE